MGNINQVFEMCVRNKLKPHPSNERFFGLNDSNYDDLKKSILENGFLVNHPILCYRKDKHLTIISGHRRWKAATELCIEEIPIIIVSDVSEIDIERIMIEENLIRPKEGRKFSYLNRYVLALRLAQNFPEQRGGDRKSAEFRAVSNIKCEPLHKNEWLAKQVGIGKKYLHELNILTKQICNEMETSYPELLCDKPIYEQLEVILCHNLSTDITDLHTGNTRINALYEKYKTPKAKPSSCLKTSPQISDAQVNHLDPKKSAESRINLPEHQDTKTPFLKAFRDFLLSEFAGDENINKAIQLLSLPVQDQVAALKTVQKVATLVLKNSGRPRLEAKKIENKQIQLLFENDTTEHNLNPNGGLK